ncbi:MULTISPECIES: LacI family DNA-binding transcriptional regulator [Kaistia]|uniref:LacI family DNA-binding transcriptional regulator n=1 Tax=Kaistia nematophila TaxID=2994654 RepID=A0A9X3E430_9HYPH|nr:LacI family DNA-binding transcriptional regulator [Kaistia nematophila]MCX5570397.1 LacI family DNA-binding transcriptional regulator [Kaistia nematophila]
MDKTDKKPPSQRKAQADASPAPARAKLEHVARLAKVSLATASRAINQPEIVRPEIRERVLHAVEMLDYTPDRMAKALSSGRTHTVGAVVPTLGNAIFADGVEALEARLGARGYTLILSHSQYDPAREFRQIRGMLEYGVDGLVLVGDTFAPDSLPLIRHHRTPLVTTYVCASRQGIPAIGIDNRQATHRMARYLLELGHREFAVIANTGLPNDRSQARLDGLLDAIAEEGIRLPPDRIFEAPLPSIAAGREAFRRLRAAHPGVTAFLCTTDAMAVGAVAEARREGIRVPEDVSITGFDDVEIAAETDPPLTTVKVPAAEIGAIAADRLIGIIEGGPAATIAPIAPLEAALVVRGSTGPVAGPVARKRRTRAAAA